ncbi:MAG TPA: hypothetical protein VFE55_09405 [Acidimicrobiia bacterium]|nr:hypothetical protein [Acidimicrobiia bacterium]
MLGTMLERVAAHAERQCGAVSLGQLTNAGLTERHVRAWIRAERILPTGARAVFRMPGAEVSWRQRLWVAVLAGPPGTVVSHASALALRGLFPSPTVPHVTVPRGSSGRFAGAVVHHATVCSADRCRLERLACTGAARAIVDCAALLDQEALDDLVDAALGRNITSYRRIVAAWDRAGRIRGGRLLAGAIEPFSGNVRLGSEKEALVLRRIHQWGLPAPECQYEIRDANGRFLARVDFGWPAWRFGLEYEGDEFHSPRRWGRDRRRLRAVESIGWRIEQTDRGDFRPSSVRLPGLLAGVLCQVAAA